jgi:hypothetical protein
VNPNAWKRMIQRRNGSKARKRGKRKMRPIAILVAAVSLFGIGLILSSGGEAAEAVASSRLPSEQENAAEKFFSSVETSLAQRFFDARKCPVIRVAVFDFTDEKGNAVRAGKELAEKITKRLYRQSQFDVVSQEKLQRYLSWNGLNTLGNLDTKGLSRFQSRVNILDPQNGIHAFITGEVQKGFGRNLRVSASLLNYRAQIGAFELENNILDIQRIGAEIPFPTEQAWQEAFDVILRGDRRVVEEGRLIVLANTQGNKLVPTEYMKAFSSGGAFPWSQTPYVFLQGREEVMKPEQVRVGLDKLLLSPMGGQRYASKQFEYAFLHGKFSTNQVYFDETLPAQEYPFLASFLDLKNNETFSEFNKIPVHAGATTVLVLSFYVPGEKERIQSKQMPRIDIFQLFGKGTEIFPER